MNPLGGCGGCWPRIVEFYCPSCAVLIDVDDAATRSTRSTEDIVPRRSGRARATGKRSPSRERRDIASTSAATFTRLLECAVATGACATRRRHTGLPPRVGFQCRALLKDGGRRSSARKSATSSRRPRPFAIRPPSRGTRFLQRTGPLPRSHRHGRASMTVPALGRGASWWDARPFRRESRKRARINKARSAVPFRHDPRGAAESAVRTASVSGSVRPARTRSHFGRGLAPASSTAARGLRGVR